jgi:hypothetical protein
MEKLVLKSWSDSNMAGDGWTWFITLTIRKDGSYSVGATHIAADEPTYRLPSIYPLRKGRQVREAIEQIFTNDALSGNYEIDWDAIHSVLSQHTPKLASEIKASFTEDIRLEEEQVRISAEKDLKEKPLNDWVNQATWERSKFSHFIAHQKDSYKRSRAVFSYAQNYYTEQGRFPTGQHVLYEGLTVQFPND